MTDMPEDMEHLGGHCGVTHVDRGALAWLRGQLPLGGKQPLLLDVGCSIGGQVMEALSLGFDAYGFDGDYRLTTNPKTLCLSRIFFNDLTKCTPQLPVKFDVVWCCEVAEHIEEAYTGNLLGLISRSLKESGLLVFTANDGPGYHHVNLKPMDWWEARLRGYGLFPRPELTKELRAVSTMKREFIKETGIVCERRAL